jgi:Rrf2 family protein
MFIYGKTAANAIAVMSYLAAEPERRAGSGEIAQARGISQALTAKLLTQLAAAGLISGQPGPGGGYTLAKRAEDISLADIIRLFEQSELPSLCPFGHNWCGIGAPCPLHDTIAEMLEANRRFIEDTRISVFLDQENIPIFPLPPSPDHV